MPPPSKISALPEVNEPMGQILATSARPDSGAAVVRTVNSVHT